MSQDKAQSAAQHFEPPPSATPVPQSEVVVSSEHKLADQAPDTLQDNRERPTEPDLGLCPVSQSAPDTIPPSAWPDASTVEPEVRDTIPSPPPPGPDD